jgi:hypothetical protein
MTPNTGTSTVGRLARPMPVTGRLGVVTLWTMWLTAPFSVLNAYTTFAPIGMLPLFVLLVCAAMYTARSTNSRSRARVPNPAVSAIGRLSPVAVVVVVMTGLMVSLAADMPLATVIAGVAATGLPAGMTPIVAAIPPREQTIR